MSRYVTERTIHGLTTIRTHIPGHLVLVSAHIKYDPVTHISHLVTVTRPSLEQVPRMIKQTASVDKWTAAAINSETLAIPPQML